MKTVTSSRKVLYDEAAVFSPRLFWSTNPPRYLTFCSLSCTKPWFWVRFTSITDLPPLFATLLTRAVKELDVMIDRLPSDSQTTEPEVCFRKKFFLISALFKIAFTILYTGALTLNIFQVAYIEQLNAVNQEASRVFTSTAEASQRLLDKFQASLREISECEMEIDRRNVRHSPWGGAKSHWHPLRGTGACEGGGWGGVGGQASPSRSLLAPPKPGPFLCSFKFLEARGPWPLGPTMSTRPWCRIILDPIFPHAFVIRMLVGCFGTCWTAQRLPTKLLCFSIEFIESKCMDINIEWSLFLFSHFRSHGRGLVMGTEPAARLPDKN